MNKSMHPYVTVIDDTNPIILFDGVCNFCAGVVQFVIRRDRDARFRFAALQSETGQRLLERHGLSTDELDTAVVVHRGQAYTKSDAGLAIARNLPTPWPWLGVLRFVPRPIRNFLYDRIAQNRYALFGRKDACMVPTPEIRGRFL